MELGAGWGASCHGSDCDEAKSCMIGTAPGVEWQELFQGSEQVPQQHPRPCPASPVHSALSRHLYIHAVPFLNKLMLK